MRLFQPLATLTEQDVNKGLRMMTLEGTVSLGFFSITTTWFLAAYALSLGASNLQIGLLAAAPFLTRLLQIPSILLVERIRRRKAIAVLTWVPAQLLWIPAALIPVFIDVPGGLAISLLLGIVTLRGVLVAVVDTAWQGWARDLVPQQILGRFYSRRLAYATITASVFGIGAAVFVDVWTARAPVDSQVLGYTTALLFGTVFLGLLSHVFMARMPEPLMLKPVLVLRW
ncbi:MAG: hypothetical protein O2812_02850 [Chloroflexi bacterium]|nr:hypothetical protein [Chloroflexota bacterium]